MPDVIDLFAGAGGFSRGFYQAGYDIVLAIDIDINASIAYKSNFPQVTFLIRDIRTVHASEIIEKYKDINILIASPPCEAFTTVSRKIMRDPLDRLYTDMRGRLTLETIRIIGDIKPEVFVIENVPGIMINPIPQFIKKEFERVGYDKVYFNILNAVEHGTPSFRKRIFISNIKLKPEKRKYKAGVGEAIKDLPDPKYPNDIPNHVYVRLPKRFQDKVSKIGWNKALEYFRGGNSKEYKQYIRLHPHKPAPTIMGKSRFIHPYEDRLITVREEARLMGYPDSHIFAGTIDDQFNQVGESVPPPLAEAIARFILKRI